MKYLKIMVSILLFTSAVAYGQSNDPIIGKWQNPSGEGRIEIVKKGSMYFGNLYWIKDRDKKDVNNPDPKLTGRNVQGLQILKNFVKEDGAYTGGEIYDPKSGKTYRCKMTLNGTDKLDIRGFIGISVFGRTETWVRIAQ